MINLLQENCSKDLLHDSHKKLAVFNAKRKLRKGVGAPLPQTHVRALTRARLVALYISALLIASQAVLMVVCPVLQQMPCTRCGG